MTASASQPRRDPAALPAPRLAPRTYTTALPPEPFTPEIIQAMIRHNPTGPVVAAAAGRVDLDAAYTLATEATRRAARRVQETRDWRRLLTREWAAADSERLDAAIMAMRRAEQVREIILYLEREQRRRSFTRSPQEVRRLRAARYRAQLPDTDRRKLTEFPTSAA